MESSEPSELEEDHNFFPTFDLSLGLGVVDDKLDERKHPGVTPNLNLTESVDSLSPSKDVLHTSTKQESDIGRRNDMISKIVALAEISEDDESDLSDSDDFSGIDDRPANCDSNSYFSNVTIKEDCENTIDEELERMKAYFCEESQGGSLTPWDSRQAFSVCTQSSDSILANTHSKSQGGTLDRSRKCQEASKNCLNSLIKFETALKLKLQEVKSKYVQVTKQIEQGASNSKYNRLSLFGILYRLGMPYFKDHDCFSAPPNEDVAKKRAFRIQKPNFSWEQNHTWTKSRADKLLKAIRSEEIRFLQDKREQYKNDLKRSLKICEDPEEKLRLESELANTDEKSYDNLSLEELVGSHNREYDWMKLSVQDLNGEIGSHNCRIMWRNYLHPRFNKAEWTAEEDARLIAIASEHHSQGWEEIAVELGSQRSAYMCCAQYHSLIYRKKLFFSADEDEELRSRVQMSRFGNYISWSKLEFLMKDRSRDQLCRRWKRLLPNIKRGRFSDEEDLIILQGVRELGTDFNTVVPRILPDRHVDQVRKRYHLLTSNCVYGNFQPSEDKLLVNLVSRFGERKSWNLIKKYFPNRDKNQLKSRFRTIVRHGGGLAPTRQLNKATAVNEQKKKRRNQYSKMSLADLRAALKKRKKLGRPKQLGRIDADFERYFSVGYSQPGGRPMVRSPSERDVSASLSVMHSLFVLLGVKLNLPQDDAIILNDPILDSITKQCLLKLRDRHAVTATVTEPTVHVAATNIDAEDPDSLEAFDLSDLALRSDFVAKPGLDATRDVDEVLLDQDLPVTSNDTRVLKPLTPVAVGNQIVPLITESSKSLKTIAAKRSFTHKPTVKKSPGINDLKNATVLSSSQVELLQSQGKIKRVEPRKTMENRAKDVGRCSSSPGIQNATALLSAQIQPLQNQGVIKKVTAESMDYKRSLSAASKNPGGKSIQNAIPLSSSQVKLLKSQDIIKPVDQNKKTIHNLQTDISKETISNVDGMVNVSENSSPPCQIELLQVQNVENEIDTSKNMPPLSTSSSNQLTEDPHLKGIKNATPLTPAQIKLLQAQGKLIKVHPKAIQSSTNVNLDQTAKHQESQSIKNATPLTPAQIKLLQAQGKLIKVLPKAIQSSTNINLDQTAKPQESQSIKNATPLTPAQIKLLQAQGKLIKVPPKAIQSSTNINLDQIEKPQESQSIKNATPLTPAQIKLLQAQGKLIKVHPKAIQSSRNISLDQIEKPQESQSIKNATPLTPAQIKLLQAQGKLIKVHPKAIQSSRNISLDQIEKPQESQSIKNATPLTPAQIKLLQAQGKLIKVHPKTFQPTTSTVPDRTGNPQESRGIKTAATPLTPAQIKILQSKGLIVPVEANKMAVMRMENISQESPVISEPKNVPAETITSMNRIYMQRENATAVAPSQAIPDLPITGIFTSIGYPEITPTNTSATSTPKHGSNVSVENERNFSMILPPSIATTGGFRTLLLSRSRLYYEMRKNWNRKRKLVELTTAAAKRGAELWQERLTTLFTMPGLMTQQAMRKRTEREHTNVFMDGNESDETVNQVRNAVKNTKRHNARMRERVHGGSPTKIKDSAAIQTMNENNGKSSPEKRTPKRKATETSPQKTNKRKHHESGTSEDDDEKLEREVDADIEAAERSVSDEETRLESRRKKKQMAGCPISRKVGRPCKKRAIQPAEAPSKRPYKQSGYFKKKPDGSSPSVRRSRGK